MSRRSVAAAVAGVALALLPATGAFAIDGRITEITSTSGKLRLVFSADSLANGVTLDPKSVTVTIDGVEIPSHASVVTTDTTVKRTAELVIDTSGSMRGEGITGAKAAAIAFVDAVPADVQVGVVTFSDKAAVRVPPTTDRNRLRTAITKLQPTGETALYDGVLLGLAEVGNSGARQVLVLSDGADTSSKAKLDSVLGRASDSKATVNTVAFKTEEGTAGVLRQIATSGNGRAVAASRAGDIGAAFRAAARAISNQLIVVADVPSDISGLATVAVTAKAGGETLSDEVAKEIVKVEKPVDTGPKRTAVGTGRFANKNLYYGALAALFLGLVGILMLGFGGLTTDRKSGRMRRRLSLYTLTGRAPPEEHEAGALGDSGVARSAVEMAGRMVQQRDLETALARTLERAGSAFKPAEWLLIHAAVTIGAALLLLLLSGGKIIPTLLGFVLGFIGPYLYLSFRGSRRTNAFLAQMPDTLQLLAGSLSAGYSLPQAVDAVVREGSQPIATEFGRAIVESRLGVPMEDALDSVATRMSSKDFAWVVMAIRIQREVGGNLAEVLTTVANTMRERERVRRQVRVLSAEGRLSAWVLGGLPPLFGIYLILVRPTYIKPLFTDPIGILMLVTVGVVFTGGVFWLRKVVQVEV
jgi:tight adherence protein B